MSIRAYTDGSCQPNPGPGGWAWVFRNRFDNSVVYLDYGGSEKTTNNRMELQAILELLRSVRGLKCTEIEIYSDSQYVIKSLIGRGSRIFFSKDGSPKYTGYARNWDFKNFSKANSDLWIAFHEELKWWGKRDLSLYVHWVRGHNGNKGNEIANDLAQYAVPRKN